MNKIAYLVTNNNNDVNNKQNYKQLGNNEK